MRYLQQRDSFRCGPFAIYNLLKWAGIKKIGKHWLSSKSVKGYISRICKTTYENGTDCNNISKVLAKIKRIKFKRINQTGVNYFKIIRKHLEEGHAVVILYNFYDWDDKEWAQHYAIATNFEDKFMTMVNAFQGNATILFTWKEFRNLASVGPFYGVAWLVEKV